MEPISGMIPGVIHSPSTVADVKVPSTVQRAEEKEQGSRITHARDEYVSEEKQEPTGRYWLGRDEDGQPKVYFDNPERAADTPEEQNKHHDADDLDQGKRADGPKKESSGDKTERCTGNTDKVDREIEKLKKKREKLEQQIDSATDDTKIKELERKLAQVESELRQKDTDTYRRQHSTFR